MPIYDFKGVRPHLGRDAFVAHNATVIGDVRLGDRASIWFGVVLRGDYFPIRVGDRTNVQDNTVLHITAGTGPTTLGDDVTVGHNATIHGCTIGNRCLIGMGSIVLDGVVIGDGSFVAAGSLLTPRTVVPPRSFVVGRPARVVRPVSDADIEAIRHGAESYVKYAEEFRSSCKRV